MEKNEGTMIYTRNKSIKKAFTSEKPVTAILQNHEDKNKSTATKSLQM
jgi:hypothetical protein